MIVELRTQDSVQHQQKIQAQLAELETMHEPRFEPCAWCGKYNRLVRIGRLWLQPGHDCD